MLSSFYPLCQIQVCLTVLQRNNDKIPQTDTQKSVNAQIMITLALLLSPLSLCIFALMAFIMPQIKKPIYCKMSLGNTLKRLAKIKTLPNTAKALTTIFIETSFNQVCLRRIGNLPVYFFTTMRTMLSVCATKIFAAARTSSKDNPKCHAQKCNDDTREKQAAILCVGPSGDQQYH